MATLPLDRYTLEEYLDMEDTLDYRSEFHDGIVLPVEAATPIHAQLEVSLAAFLLNAFGSRCLVYGSSPNLYIASGNKVLHPDATVLCVSRITRSRIALITRPFWLK
jgi:Uma2 family endonuclease